MREDREGEREIEAIVVLLVLDQRQYTSDICRQGGNAERVRLANRMRREVGAGRQDQEVGFGDEPHYWARLVRALGNETNCANEVPSEASSRYWPKVIRSPCSS